MHSGVSPPKVSNHPVVVRSTSPASSRRPLQSGNQPRSMIALRVVQEAMKTETTVGDLARLASSDPAFAIRVLTAVNSPAFGVARQITDVHQGSALLGVRGLRNVALSLTLSDMVPPIEGAETLLANGLRRAVTMKLIGQALEARQVDDYFTIGLFLEVGLLALARTDVGTAIELARMPAGHRVIAERADGAGGHPSTGAEIARQYSLGVDVVESVLHHHDATPPEGSIPRAAWAAERCAAIWEGGDLLRLREDARQACGAIGLRDATFERIISAVPGLVMDAATIIDRTVSEQLAVDELLIDANRSLVELNSSYAGLVRRLEDLVREKDNLAEQLREANARLEHLAATDSLTGLPNKRVFMDALTRDIAAADRAETDVSLVFLDADHFKKVNDTYGHQTGDEVLRTIAEILRRGLRASDLAARYGGEEFVLLLPGTPPPGARVVAERMRAALAATSIQGPAGTFRVTASFGVAGVKGPGCKALGEFLVERADQALYQAKHAGRNRVVVDG